MEPSRQARRFDYIMSAMSVVAIVLLLWAEGSWLVRSRNARNFDTFEDRARNAVTGPELQAWATSLLARQPANSNRNGGQIRLDVSGLGADFPKQLLELFPGVSPRFYYEAGGEDHPGWITIDWGGGRMGHTGFDIGATNFTDQPKKRGHAWQPGVYFWKEAG